MDELSGGGCAVLTWALHAADLRYRLCSRGGSLWAAHPVVPPAKIHFSVCVFVCVCKHVCGAAGDGTQSSCMLGSCSTPEDVLEEEETTPTLPSVSKDTE